MWFKIVYSLGLRRPLRAGCGGSDACMLYGTALCANGWAFVPDVLWAGSCLLDFGPSVLCLVVCLPDLWHVNPSTAPAAGCCRWAPISCHPMTSPECSSPRQQSGLREPAGSGAVQLSCLMLPSKPIGCPTAMGGVCACCRGLPWWQLQGMQRTEWLYWAARSVQPSHLDYLNTLNLSFMRLGWSRNLNARQPAAEGGKSGSAPEQVSKQGSFCLSENSSVFIDV